jgi:hypothetical protein
MRRGVGRCYLPVFLESRNCRTTKEGGACFAVGDAGKMMFGLVNRIARDEPGLTPAAAGNIPADQIAALELYHRSRNNRDAIGAQIYLAEFLRLCEHYRARARFIEWKRSGQAPQDAGFALRPHRGWADRHYTAGAPEYKARVRMLSVT